VHLELESYSNLALSGGDVRVECLVLSRGRLGDLWTVLEGPGGGSADAGAP
jgi:hypothetical protein